MPRAPVDEAKRPLGDEVRRLVGEEVMRLLGEKARRLLGDEVRGVLGDKARRLLAIGDWLLVDTTPPDIETPAALLPPPKDFIV